MRARNSVDSSLYSSTFTIVAATVPSQPSAPITSVNNEFEIGISWTNPSDLGGLSISGYKLEIKTATGTFEKDLTNCNAESNSSIISARTCVIPTTVLRSLPFSIGDSDIIYARVTAINSIGESSLSSEGSGASMPIQDVEPDPPTALLRDEGSTT